jgi:hypothetical protein
MRTWRFTECLLYQCQLARKPTELGLKSNLPIQPPNSLNKSDMVHGAHPLTIRGSDKFVAGGLGSIPSVQLVHG